jgi:acetyl esterase/lipase
VIQSALSQGSKIKSLMASYSPLDLKIPFFEEASERSMAGFPMMPEDMLSKHIASLKGDEVVSTATPPFRLDLAFAAIQQGKFVELLGSNPSLFPMERLATAKDLPTMFILHGESDSAVPYQSSEAFAKKVKELHPDVDILYTVVPGQEHGIDSTATFETPWLKEGLDFITSKWLGTKNI